MRITKINKYYQDPGKSEEIELHIEPSRYTDDLDIFEPQNKKQLKKFIGDIKYLMRKSYEYRRLMKFLKTDKGLGICGVHPNISNDDGFSIEIHHTPFVAEDIIYTVLNKRYKCGEELKMGLIVEEIMLLHYMKLIGLYPLCETCHGYIHSDDNDLFIPLSKIYGEPGEFYKLYKEYMTDELRGKFETYLLLNQGYQIIEDNLPFALMKKYIYVNVNSDENMISTKRLTSFINETSN